MRSITREQRMLAAAAANVLFIICLFFPWYGVGEFDLSGEDEVGEAGGQRQIARVDQGEVARLELQVQRAGRAPEQIPRSHIRQREDRICSHDQIARLSRPLVSMMASMPRMKPREIRRPISSPS